MRAKARREYEAAVRRGDPATWEGMLLPMNLKNRLGLLAAFLIVDDITLEVFYRDKNIPSSRAGANNEANQTVELVTNAPVPVGGTLELLSGNKVVMETTDTLSLTASGAADITLSIMEIT